MPTWIGPRLGLLTFLTLSAAAIGSMPTATARAQEEAAREHFKRGEAAYQQGNYSLAIQEWETAYAADPRPRIQYNIYQAYERLGKLGQASDALQRYLSTADPGDPNYSDATARMASLQQRLQATGVRIVGGIEGASINVSGHDWGRLPRPDRIPVQPGNHRILIQLQGYKDFISNVVVPAGQVVDIPVQLEPEPAAAPPPAQAAPQGQPASASGTGSASVSTGMPHDTGDDPLPFFIASGALGAAAIGSAIWTVNRVGELDGCDAPENFCPEEDAVSTQRNIALGLTIVLSAGAIGSLIYGLVLGSSSDAPAESEGAGAPRCIASPLGASCRVHF